ncbi:hypothetical protein RSOL_077430 [Rhizoctonia solani AG-3 Rhs1AP]|uniref:Uncharacterized protein n=1 Tax=Rhizoctonia solani AG-3 Rhs1AP TaxID=1086054 RepID=X8IXS1_9AGAM|nr:hypothetical protein RSOL_077430 [Rhizoctonia solani AG-3 Rhs1AP]
MVKKKMDETSTCGTSQRVNTFASTHYFVATFKKPASVAHCFMDFHHRALSAANIRSLSIGFGRR